MEAETSSIQHSSAKYGLNIFFSRFFQQVLNNRWSMIEKEYSTKTSSLPHDDKLSISLFFVPLS
jgi:hypothetical protein